MHRLEKVLQQVQPAVEASGQLHPKATSAGTGVKLSPPDLPLRANGWGFKDTSFEIQNSGEIALTGNRYLFSGKTLPSLRKWMEEKVGVNIDQKTPSQPECKPNPAIRNEAFLKAIEGLYSKISHEDAERVFHGHGHTCQEVWTLRYGKFDRVPDVVVWPASHEHVEAIVKAANAHDVVIIPFGGGTSVSQALLCPSNEKRMIVSLDMHHMCKIKWINKQSMMACIEAGVTGRELDKALRSQGVILGHEPDSVEFSTMGGWVATRASGMRKNKYGNIEDIVLRVKMVTSQGTVEKSVQVPRMSTGPDINQFILGSEGTLGVITEVVVKLSLAPEVTKYGSILFPDFQSGVACLYEVAMRRCAPVSIRLVDNMQFQFGQALKPASHKWSEALIDKAKKWYVLNAKKFEPEKMVAATLVFEGTKAEVAAQEARIYSIAAKYGGMKAGEENGIRGFFLTYMIAYLRDFGFEFSFMGESFETSVPWDQVEPLCKAVKDKIRSVTKAHGVKHEPFVSCRVTQLYDTGACVYFYFGFVWTGLKDPIAVFSEVEHEAREEILRFGGSLSHHHGVGKLRKHWMEQTVSPVGIQMLTGVKRALDPRNIFAAGNLIDVDAPTTAAAPTAKHH